MNVEEWNAYAKKLNARLMQEQFPVSWAGTLSAGQRDAKAETRPVIDMPKPPST